MKKLILILSFAIGYCFGQSFITPIPFGISQDSIYKLV